MPRVTAKDGTELYYKDWGNGPPVVVMIHGWPLCADMFNHAATEFVDGGGFRVIAPDRRGFGRSDQPSSGYDYDTFADDIAAVLLHAGVNEPIVIIGFSMGGGEVARYITRHGAAQVSHAILVSSILPYLLQSVDNPKGIPHVEFEQMVSELRYGREDYFRKFFVDYFGAASGSQAVLDDAWRQAMMAGLWPTMQCVFAFAETDFRPDMQNFKMPTLVLHGVKDTIVPIGLTARVVANSVPSAKLNEYPHGHHGLFAGGHGEVVVSHIFEFLGNNRNPAKSRASEQLS